MPGLVISDLRRAARGCIRRAVPGILAMAVAGAGHAATPDQPEEIWRLEVDSKYTCVGTTGVSYNHSDTHKGSVSFVMPEEQGKVNATGGDYLYHTVGQTMGNPWEFTGPGTLTFKGEVIPGTLRFTPQVYLADGQAFFDPVETVEMPIFDGSTYDAPVHSVAEVKCDGYFTYTLRGTPKEKYKVLVDDRLMWSKSHGVYSGTSYSTGVTIQVLTEVEITVEGKKVKDVTGSRRIGRVTPSSNPPGVWTINEITGKCPDGVSYPHAPGLSNSEVSASVRNETTIALAVKGGTARAAVEWTIDPKAAKAVSPDIQYGKPERFNDYWCADLPLLVTGWSFTRRRDSITITADTFDHLQIFEVRQQATASSTPSGGASAVRPRAKYFQGDKAP